MKRRKTASEEEIREEVLRRREALLRQISKATGIPVEELKKRLERVIETPGPIHITEHGTIRPSPPKITITIDPDVKAMYDSLPREQRKAILDFLRSALKKKLLEMTTSESS